MGMVSIDFSTMYQIRPFMFGRSDRIIWYKGDEEIKNNEDYRISKKGILKIVKLSYADNTTFTCKGTVTYIPRL